MLLTACNKIKEDFIQIRFALLPTILYCCFMQIFFHTLCPFLAFFHRQCPGCGLTRSILSLLSGNLQKSLEYNWTGIFWFITILLFLFDRYIKELKIKPFPVLFSIVGILTILRYILLF